MGLLLLSSRGNELGGHGSGPLPSPQGLTLYLDAHLTLGVVKIIDFQHISCPVIDDFINNLL